MKIPISPRQQRRQGKPQDQRHGQRLERLPEPGQGGDVVPAHEIGQPVHVARAGLQLEVHRHHVRADAKVVAAQVQDPGGPPGQRQRTRHHRKRQVAGKGVQLEPVKAQRRGARPAG